MFQVQGCSEPDPLLATLEKYAFVYLQELLEAVLYRTNMVKVKIQRTYFLRPVSSRVQKSSLTLECCVLL